MIKHKYKTLQGLLLGLCLWCVSTSIWAADVLTVAYLQLENDARYSYEQRFARYLTQPLGRPYAGAQVALAESKFHAMVAGARFELKRVSGKTDEDLVAAVKQQVAQGIHFIVLDVPAATVEKVAAATTDLEVILFNVSARADRLRQAKCQAHLLHTLPNDSMLMDALAQYLVSRKWRRVLMLAGPKTEDQGLNVAFERAAKRYGITLTAKRVYELSNDPRKRDQNNIALLTNGDNYDVIFVADTEGEFARNVPYHSVQPKLVVGSEGLAPMAWHWAWERHGAPQLEKRFEDTAGRAMRDYDWAAWMAVKALAEAVQRTKSIDFSTVRDYLLSEDLVLDSFKGNRSSFRSWDRQLRQPILLGTHNWVVARAPLDGFLHQKNKLDTLGFDERESDCEF